MNVREEKNTSMPICILAAIFAVLRMATGNTMFMIIFTAIVSIAILFAKAEDKFDYIIFFSTWATMLKFNQESYSVFLLLTAEFCLLSFFDIIRYKKRIDSSSFSVTLLFFLYVFFTAAFATKSFDQLFGFVLNFLVIAIAFIHINSKKIPHIIWLFSTGLLIQGIVSFLAMNGFLGNLWSYITIYGDDTVYTSTSGLLSRFSGFAGDPNYFAAELLFAISGLLLLYEKQERKFLVLSVIAILLLFGFFTLSKMYLICATITVIIALRTIAKKSAHSGVFVTLAFIILILVLWRIYGSMLIEGFTIRLEDTSSLNVFTSGRSDIWLNYIDAIFTDPFTLLFGVGYGAGFHNNRGAHNGYISMLYFFGIIGCLIFISLIKCYIKVANKTLSEETAKKKFFRKGNLPLFIMFIVNLSLDAVLMDFFPMMLFMATCCSSYHTTPDKSNNLKYR